MGWGRFATPWSQRTPAAEFRGSERQVSPRIGKNTVGVIHPKRHKTCAMSHVIEKVAGAGRNYPRRAHLGRCFSLSSAGELERVRIPGPRHQPIGRILARICRVSFHPTFLHQRILKFLCAALDAFVIGQGLVTATSGASSFAFSPASFASPMCCS
jgi:hypothetical protein